MAEKWIQKAIKHKGALRKTLGVKAGKDIPAAKLKKAEHSKNPTTRKTQQKSKIKKKSCFSRNSKRIQKVMKKKTVKEKKVKKVMHEYKEGKLHSGSKKGPIVTNPKQAIAISLSEAKKASKKK